MFALVSARGLVRVGWDRGAQTEPCQKPSIQLPSASVDGRKALTAKGKKALAALQQLSDLLNSLHQHLDRQRVFHFVFSV
jgi:hypothetical protein